MKTFVLIFAFIAVACIASEAGATHGSRVAVLSNGQVVVLNDHGHIVSRQLAVQHVRQFSVQHVAPQRVFVQSGVVRLQSGHHNQSEVRVQVNQRRGLFNGFFRGNRGRSDVQVFVR